MGVSWNGGTPSHPFLDGIFHHKPSGDEGVPLWLWKPSELQGPTLQSAGVLPRFFSRSEFLLSQSKDITYRNPTHMLHVWYIYLQTYIWLIFRAHVGKYFRHGAYELLKEWWSTFPICFIFGISKTNLVIDKVVKKSLLSWKPPAVMSIKGGCERVNRVPGTTRVRLCFRSKDTQI